MNNNTFDVIIVGAGSVGNPAALFLSEAGLKVLVLDKRASAGQGENKAAIGGVRATHSDGAKIMTSIESLKVFSTWKEKYGDNIDWKTGGYCFPVYTESLENQLKGYFDIQRSFGLEINWMTPDEISELVPGINMEGLRGGTYSPGDGQVSPLKMASFCYFQARKAGAQYNFNETVVNYIHDHEKISGVITNRGRYYADRVVIATGADAALHGVMLNREIPVNPDSHEAGISAPVAKFLPPLVVDMRPGPEGKTANFYFGQASGGQIIFCYTPKPAIVGNNREGLSEFMPVLANRLITLMPRFKNLLIRKTWRGLYPMTPDGVPIIDYDTKLNGLIWAVGMCGQGFMLGPGVAKNITSMIVDSKPMLPEDVQKMYSLSRNFYEKTEAFK
ncbi:MAG: FAD-binding oxidoreductase [Deltaproteobacteria bacterium]|nr:FAD-binding oxidoreductase [Deltaproteobacteria bacterium]